MKSRFLRILEDRRQGAQLREEDDQHIIAKLRGIADLSEMKPIRFNDGHSTTVPPEVAKHAVTTYEGMKSAEDKSGFAASLHHSLGSFKQAVGLKEDEDFLVEDDDKYHKFIQHDSLGNANHIHVHKETGAAFSPHYKGRGSAKDLSYHMFKHRGEGGYAEQRKVLSDAIKKAHPKGKDAILSSIRSATQMNDWHHNHKNLKEDEMNEAMAQKRKFVFHYTDKRTGEKTTSKRESFSPRSTHRFLSVEGHKVHKVMHGKEDVTDEAEGWHNEETENMTDQLAEARRSMFQHDDIDFKKVKNTEGDETPTWEVHHKGKHIGHMTQHEEETHHLSTGRYRHSAGKSTQKVFRYHPTTVRPTGYVSASRRKHDIYNNKEDLSRHAARHGESLKEDTTMIDQIDEKKDYDSDDVKDIQDRKRRGKAAAFVRKSRDKEKRQDAFEEVELTEEEIDLINEISKKTLGSYVRKAAGDMRAHSRNATASHMRASQPIENDDDRERSNRNYGEFKKSTKKANNREDGIHSAVRRLTKEEYNLDLTEEEFLEVFTLIEDQLDEISKKTLGSYVKKAATDRTIYGRELGGINAVQNITGKERPERAKYVEKRLEKRTDGIHHAINRLTKEDVAPILSAEAVALAGPKGLDEAVRAILSTNRNLEEEARIHEFKKRSSGQ